jgi:hypothetical protein
MTNRLLILLFLVSSISKAQNFPQIYNRWGVNDSISVEYTWLMSDGLLKTIYSHNSKFTIDSNVQIRYDYSNYDSLAGIWHPYKYRKWSGDTLSETYQWDPLLNQYKPDQKTSILYNSDGCHLSTTDSIYDPLTLSWNYYSKYEFYYRANCELDSQYLDILNSPYSYVILDSVGSFSRRSHYSFDQATSTWALSQQDFNSSTGDTMFLRVQSLWSNNQIDTSVIVYRKYDNGGNEIQITEELDYGTPPQVVRFIRDSTYFVSISTSLILKERHTFTPPSAGGGLSGSITEQWVYSNNQLNYKATFDSSNQLTDKIDFYYFPNGYLQKQVELESNGSSLDTIRVIEVEHFSINNIGYNEVLHQSILIAPNPADDNIRIIGIDEVFNYQLVSIDGRIVKEGTGFGEISVEELPKGVYSVILISGLEQHRTKFLKL